MKTYNEPIELGLSSDPAPELLRIDPSNQEDADGSRIKSLEQEKPISPPYVVSADVQGLISSWATDRNFTTPEPIFFRILERDLQTMLGRIFPSVELVSQLELRDGLSKLVAATALPTVSLDGVYFTSSLQLDASRLVDADGNDRGIGRRPGTPRLREQLRQLKASCVKEVILVDDVLFSGTFILRIAKLLQAVGIETKLVVAGIGIGEGVATVQQSGIPVQCVKTYENVLDEICERDFVPGVSQSGRTLAGAGNIGLPYLLPFGNPGNWASIPEQWQRPFSVFCIRQAIELFSEIERCSGRPVLCRDIDRKVAGLPNDETPFVDALRMAL